MLIRRGFSLAVRLAGVMLVNSLRSEVPQHLWDSPLVVCKINNCNSYCTLATFVASLSREQLRTDQQPAFIRAA
jgi:hypothetical protein